MLISTMLFTIFLLADSATLGPQLWVLRSILFTLQHLKKSLSLQHGFVHICKISPCLNRISLNEVFPTTIDQCVTTLCFRDVCAEGLCTECLELIPKALVKHQGLPLLFWQSLRGKKHNRLKL